MPIVSLIKIAIVVLGVILVVLVILQQGESGLSETFGGQSSFLSYPPRGREMDFYNYYYYWHNFCWTVFSLTQNTISCAL